MKSYLVALAFLLGIFSIFYGDETGAQGIHNLANRVPFPWGQEDKELQAFYRKMLAVRANNIFLRTAECEIREVSAEYFMYERISEQESILVIASRAHHETQLHIPEEYQDAEIIFCIQDDTNSKWLMPYGAIVLRKKQS